MFRIAMLIGAMASLPALAQAQSQGAADAYRCPTAGMTIERTRGESFTYRGQGQAPFVCTTSTGVPRFLGYWSVSENFYRTGRADLERMMTTALSGGRPAPVLIPYSSHSSVGYIPISVAETWTVPGAERVSTPAGAFDALRVERVFQIVDSVYRYKQTLWVDRQSGIPVRVEVEHLNGIMAANIFSWQAASIHSAHVTSSR